MERSIRSRVSGWTVSGAFSTRETLWWETPACLATSIIEGRLAPLRFAPLTPRLLSPLLEMILPHPHADTDHQL
ncbi:hypothetical protein GCM10009650_16510 [Nesterenkonia jeotgali]